jgi:o-succinylbenzoate synthase
LEDARRLLMLTLHEDTRKPLISRYRLKSRDLLNAVSGRREFDGVLIKMGEGYGCIHPWPELGDPPLEKCLADLAGPRRWPIVRRAIRCAEYDAAARSREESLFEEMEVPRSHATLPSADVAFAEQAIGAGFTHLKLKCGRDAAKERACIEAVAEAHPSLRWRVDFNESLDPASAVEWVGGLSESARRTLDFLEDPSPYSESAWGKLFRDLRIPLAVDREAAPTSKAAQVCVIKPAIDEPWMLGEAALGNGQRLVVTSYMDHPVGQAFAAWEAARLGLEFPGQPGVCGLRTDVLFKPDAFSEMMGEWSPEFTPPPGTGLGFDDLLDALPWTRLY